MSTSSYPPPAAASNALSVSPASPEGPPHAATVALVVAGKDSHLASLAAASGFAPRSGGLRRLGDVAGRDLRGIDVVLIDEAALDEYIAQPTPIYDGEAPLVAVLDRPRTEHFSAALRAGVGEIVAPGGLQNLRRAVATAIRARRGAGDSRRAERAAFAKWLALSDSQRRVAELLLEGKTNTQIAAEIDRCVRTVESIRAKIMSALGATNSVQLAYQLLLVRSADAASGGIFSMRP